MKNLLKNEENTLEEKELWLWTFILIVVWILVIWVIFWISVVFWLNKWEDRWTFWDMFWAVNSLFSWLALAGIIYTMLLQRQELRLQRLELKANTEELARAATAQENSERELKRQADNLKATARLNALNTLISYHQSNIQNKDNSLGFTFFDKQEIEQYIQETRAILNWKS